MTKSIHEILEGAVDQAMINLLTIRPDLDNPSNKALARMVAKDAVSACINDLRNSGYLTDSSNPMDSLKAVGDIIRYFSKT